MPGPNKNTPPPLHYRVETGGLHAHLFRVTLTIAQPAALQRVSLPVWIPGSYLAADYDELVDCPVEMGPFWSGSFKACGVPHRFVVAGASASFDGARLLADTQKICETAIRFWHGSKKPPYKSYLFMLNAVDD